MMAFFIHSQRSPDKVSGLYPPGNSRTVAGPISYNMDKQFLLSLLKFKEGNMSRTREEEFKIEDYSAWLLCYFLLLTGLRVTEALSCNMKDLNWNKHTLAVKAQKTPNHYHLRYLPLPETLLNEIAQWTKLHSLKPQDHLFDFDAATARNKVKKAFQFAGIDDDEGNKRLRSRKSN